MFSVRIYIILLVLVLATLGLSAQGSSIFTETKSPKKFHAAIESGDLNQACSFLMSGANPNAVTALGQKPIHLAHQVDMVELLVNHGARVNSVDNYNETALLMAAFDADVNRVEFLLKNGADPNIPNSNSYTPLLLGLEPVEEQVRRTKIAKLLLEFGADPNVRTRFTQSTPLFYAVRANNKEVVSMLIEKGAQLNGDQGEEMAPLDLVDPKENPPLFKLLVKAGAKHFQLREKLLSALYEENHSEIDAILAKGIDLDFYYEEEGLSPLILSVRYLSDISITEKFLMHGARPDLAAPKTKATPLHSAIAYLKPLSVVELLLDQGADLEAKDLNDWTPLMFAAAMNRIDIVEFLLDRGAEIDGKNLAGKTALELAETEEHQAVVALIIEKSRVDE